ncbi:hypothetical protein [Gelidibacter pelagius]|uniref:TonB-dependent receptor-like protein n=1 Tax=Gelidibacter pelagius TaxID=2819985 RepID=A0ABS3SNM4_9FLAO|nr:hypothetical protein [Gelidibacter pelagius]MBO3097300.1 hypothetical protein [Gelidibacter pelagius]
MKTAKFIKIGLGVIFVAIISLISLKTFAHKSEPSAVVKNEALINENTALDENTSITIDSNTSDSEFEDIQTLLKEQQITASFTQIERNDAGKITGIKIELTDTNGNQAVSQMSSNVPIPQIVFGKKDGSLYIARSSKEQGAMAFFNRPNMAPFGFDNDSLGALTAPQFGNFNFDDFFNDEDHAFFLNGQTLNLDELREQMKKQMESGGLLGNNLSWFFDTQDNNSPLPNKFNFRDDPNSNKLIIIDGKESDFQTLDELAKSNRLQTVDHLQSDTAISIYGKKAKDGAVIATTKKNQ